MSNNDKYFVSWTGTSYSKNTPKEVIRILDGAFLRKERIRVFYGDVKTGRCWNDEFDTIGRVGRSTGIHKIPLLIKTCRSFGGGSILDNCIVRITIDKKVVYSHPNFHTGELIYRGIDNYVNNEGDLANGYEVCRNGEGFARFSKEEQAKKYIKFLKGERNSK